MSFECVSNVLRFLHIRGFIQYLQTYLQYANLMHIQNLHHNRLTSLCTMNEHISNNSNSIPDMRGVQIGIL